MKKSLHKFYIAIYESVKDLIDHDAIEHSGYLTYIFILSLFPSIILLFSIAGLIGESSFGQNLIDICMNNLPEHVQHTIKPRIDEITSGPPQGILTIAILGAIWTASSSFEGLRTIFNRAFRVTSPPAYIFRRMLSIIQFLLFTISLIFLMFSLFFLPVVVSKFSTVTGIPNSFWDHFMVFRDFTILFILFLCVSCLYLFLPNIKLKFIDVIPGAVLVVILWLVFGLSFSKYINNYKQLNLIYGSLEGIIITLLYFFINNLILIFGAEFNYNFNAANKSNDKAINQ